MLDEVWTTDVYTYVCFRVFSVSFTIGTLFCVEVPLFYL